MFFFDAWSLLIMRSKVLFDEKYSTDHWETAFSWTGDPIFDLRCILPRYGQQLDAASVALLAGVSLFLQSVLFENQAQLRSIASISKSARPIYHQRNGNPFLFLWPT